MAVLHTTKLSDETARKLANFAAQLQVTKSEIIRSAIEQYLAFQDGRSWSPNRVAELTEYTQMAVDQILVAIAPDRRDEIIQAVTVRMEKYHGG